MYEAKRGEKREVRGLVALQLRGGRRPARGVVPGGKGAEPPIPDLDRGVLTRDVRAAWDDVRRLGDRIDRQVGGVRER